jgi:hypothetical protein
MAITSSKTGIRQHNNNDNDNGCVENDTATQRAINIERRKYCNKLYEAAGEVSKYEKTSDGQLSLYGRKKCMFLWTEDNYQRYRNTEIRVGTELVLSTELISKNVTNYIGWGNELSANLKRISKSVKDIKTKMNDLREAACKLENCLDDSCNSSQVIALTGEMSDKMKGETKTKSEKKRPEECNEVKKLLDDLICMPKALTLDIDSIFKSAADVVGIQVFSNLGTLNPLQKSLSDKSGKFASHLLETSKTRENDLKKARLALVECVQESTRATFNKYNDRSDFEGALESLDFLCCPDCGCVDKDCICDPRLKECENQICAICDEVKTTFCEDNESENVKHSAM